MGTIRDPAKAYRPVNRARLKTQISALKKRVQINLGELRAIFRLCQRAELEETNPQTKQCRKIPKRNTNRHLTNNENI